MNTLQIDKFDKSIAIIFYLGTHRYVQQHSQLVRCFFIAYLYKYIINYVSSEEK